MLSHLPEFIAAKNLVMVKILWTFLIVDILLCLFIGDYGFIVTLLLSSFIPLLLASFFIKKKIYIRITMYTIIAVLYIVLFIAIEGMPAFFNYIFIWLNLLLISFYQNFRPVLVSGVISLFYINYFYIQYGELIFLNRGEFDLVFINFFTLCIIIYLVAESRFFSRILFNSWQNERNAKQAQEQTEKLLLQLQSSTQETLTYIAYNDEITNLPNSKAFKEYLRFYVSRNADAKTIISLFYIRIDNLKIIFSTLGDKMGQQVLKQTAVLLKEYVPKSGFLSMAASNSFMFLLQTKELSYFDEFAAKLVKTLEQSLRLDDHEFHITFSIGISLYPNHTKDLEQLVDYAELTVHQTTFIEKNNFNYYEPAYSDQVERTLFYYHEILLALKLNQFTLVYQPQFDIETDQIIGAEALIRWTHPMLGNISPFEFIHVAEDTGLIHQVGEWVINEVCATINKLREAGIQPIPISVNIAAKQFYKRDFALVIQNSLSTYQIEPEFFSIEITESAVSRDVMEFIQILHKLNEMGIKISVDDFGTGFSSLSYLIQFPIHTLKIDQSFISNLESDARQVAIIVAIIHLAKSLGLKTIAEGVETQVQFDLLRAHGCDSIQGFLYSKPLPFHHFKQLLMNR